MFGDKKLIEENLRLKLEIFRVLDSVAEYKDGAFLNPTDGSFYSTFKAIGITSNQISKADFMKEYELVERKLINLCNK